MVRQVIMYKQSMEEKRPRSEWIDLARGICMILVVFCHTYSWAGIRYYVYMFHLPVFFVVAGYFYRNRSLKEEIKKSFKALIWPFLWTGLFIAVGCIAFDGGNPLHIIASMLLCFSFDKYNIFISVGAVWFLGCLFCARILFHIVMTRKKNIWVVIMFSVMTALAGEMISKLIYFPYSFDVAMVAQLFIMCGYYYHQYEDKADRFFGKNITFLLLAVIAMMFGFLEHRLATGYFNLAGRSYPFHLLSVLFNAVISIALLQLCKKFCLWNRFTGIVRRIAYIGRNSLLVLCVHSIEDRWTSRFRTGTLMDIVIFCVKFTVIIAIVITIKHVWNKICDCYKFRGGVN